MNLSTKRPSIEQKTENIQTKSVSFVIEENKYKALKIFALNQNKTIKQVLNEAIERLLTENQSNPK